MIAVLLKLLVLLDSKEEIQINHWISFTFKFWKKKRREKGEVTMWGKKIIIKIGTPVRREKVIKKGYKRRSRKEKQLDWTLPSIDFLLIYIMEIC